MSNYDNINWQAVAEAQLKAKGEVLQGLYDAYQKALKLNLENYDAYPVYGPTGIATPEGVNEYGFDRTSKEDIIAYLIQNPGKTAKVLDRSLLATNENDVWNTYGEYSLDANGMLKRTESQEHQDIGQDDSSFFKPSWSGMLSGLTLGVSDLVKGNMPGTDWANQGTLTQIVNPASQVHSMFTGGAADLVYGIDKAGRSDGDFWSKAGVAVDRAMDPFGVDTMVRTTGDIARDINPEKFDKYVAPYAGAAGTAIGALIYGGPGAAAGYGIGTKFGQGTRNYDYLKDLVTAGTIYATYGTGSGAGDAVKSLTGSAVLGAATAGAISGVVSSVPSAIQQRSWDPLWKGALVGGVAGGVGSGARVGAYGLGASKAIANLTGNVAGKVASTGMKQLWLNNNKG